MPELDFQSKCEDAACESSISAPNLRMFHAKARFFDKNALALHERPVAVKIQGLSTPDSDAEQSVRTLHARAQL